MPRPSPTLLAGLVLAGLSLPFIGKPVHLDDANFLMLARGAAADPWRPHAVEVNWQGQTESAFAVLSNPPGIGWWLAPVAEGAVWVQHLAMLPWLFLAVWGCATLGRRFVGAPATAALLICGSPMGLLAAHALMPDLPLLACASAGLAGLTRRDGPSLAARWPWALLAGAAVLFRYSGLTMVPLVALWAVLHRDPRGAWRTTVAAAVPFVALALHDLAAYGQVHFVAMMGFQGVSDTPRDVFRKGAVAVAMLGGAGVLPVLALAVPKRAGLGLLVGGGLATAALWTTPQTGGAAVATVLALCAGTMTLAGALDAGDRDRQFLSLWAIGGLVFLLALRFTAARYWLPFLPPVALLALQAAGPRLRVGALGLTLPLSLALAWDDDQLARAQADLADLAAAQGTGLVAGHWGFQHHLEQAGWTALEDDGPVPPGVLLAVSQVAWPQEPAPGSCLQPVLRHSIADPWPGPRVHTAAGGANIHAYVVAGRPPTETYAPWTWHQAEPLDTLSLWRGCP